MIANGVLNSRSSEPTTRWDCSDVDQEMVKNFLGERLRFPYASNLTVQNRIMKSAMSEQLATYDKNDMTKSGVPTRELINLYEKFADGGFGIIVTGCIMINGKDIEAPGNIIIDRQLDCEERRNAFKEWAQCAKRNGSIIIAQLFHPGKYAADLPHKTDFNINKLTRKQLSELINEYAYAASYAQQCGFNGVEISCTYFFALGQLITSSQNNRDDEFGGDLENRAKILFKIIQAIRMKIYKPSSFVIGLKLFCGNFEPDYNNDAFGEFVHNIEKTGFDYITITGGNYNLIKDLERGDDPKKCEYFYQKFVLTMRNHLTRTKLFMNGGFVTLEEMIAAIRSGWAAGISLARPVAAEPDLPNRLFAGEVKSAAKSLFDPADYSVEIKFAGTQLWQHGCLLTVMDASNPDHIEQFKKDLHLFEKQKLIASNDGDNAALIIGYPKTIVNPELLDKDLLERIQQLSKDTKAVTLDNHQEKSELATTKIDDDTTKMMVEEDNDHVMTKKPDYESSGDLQENIVEDSIHKIMEQHENSSNVGVDMIEETIEKVITQSDFSEPFRPKLDALEQEEQVGDGTVEVQADDDFISHGNGVLNATPETVNSSFSDVKTVLEATLKEDVKIAGEAIKDVTEGLRIEDEKINEAAADEQSNKKILCPMQESKTSGTAEVISGLSDDDKPIISGIIEEVTNTNDDTIKSMESDAKQENIENLVSENEKQLVTDREPFIGDENYDIDENIMEEVKEKKIYGMSAEMTASFIKDSVTHQTELSLGKSDEDISKFQDTEEYHEITNDDDKGQQQDHLQDHFQDHIVEAHAPEGVTEAYIPKDITNYHIPESMDGRFLDITTGNDLAGGLADNHFQQDLGYDMKGDLQSEASISKDVAADDPNQEYPLSNTYKAEGFLEDRIGQSGWNELSGETDRYEVSPPYATLLGSTLMSGNDESVAYEEYYDKHSVPAQSPEEIYHSEIYGISDSTPKNTKNGENLSSEKVDMSQVQSESEIGVSKSLTDNNSKEKQKHGFAGFISSALPESVQSLISSTKMKFDEMLSEDDRKHQPDLQFTMKTEEMIGDGGNKYEIHTESYTVSSADHNLSPDFSNNKAFLVGDSDKFVIHDNDSTESTATHHSTETTITRMTTSDGQESKQHNDGLFSGKKSTDELDFEFIR